jgi:hypothetical protein
MELLTTPTGLQKDEKGANMRLTTNLRVQAEPGVLEQIVRTSVAVGR